jgi:hypothetical protein
VGHETRDAPIYRDKRVFSVSHESRITPVAGERRIVKVAA